MTPLADQIACVRREIAMREAVYPRRVHAGKMPERMARREIETMKAVLETLCDLQRVGVL